MSTGEQFDRCVGQTRSTIKLFQGHHQPISFSEVQIGLRTDFLATTLNMLPLTNKDLHNFKPDTTFHGRPSIHIDQAEQIRLSSKFVLNSE